MEELIFIAVIILFSVLDAIAKKKRQEGGAGEEAPVEDEPSAAERWDARQRELERDLDLEAQAGEPAIQPFPDAEEAGGSESMVPRDIWEEIGALARGERTEPPPLEEADLEPSWRDARGPGQEDLPAPVPSSSPIRRSQVRSGEVGGRAEVGSHPIHRSHADYGTDPSERAPVPALPTSGPSREARAVRRALVEGGAAEARKAVILHEVLGPPLAYREEDPGA